MTFDLSIGAGASAAVEYMLDNYSPALDAIADGIGFFADGIKDGLLWLPSWAFIAVVALVALWRTGWKSAVTFVLALSLIVGMGLWKETIETLALVIAASAISVTIGIPLGILTARSALLAAGTRPVLDLMQTMPAFVYLVPFLALFSATRFTAIVAAVVFAAPVAIKIIADGVRTVPATTVEAATSTGCNTWQIITKVQLPMARSALTLATNQGLIYVLSMVVVGGLVGAGALGYDVVAGFSQGELYGKGLAAGVAIVLLGVMFDRITQAAARRTRA